MNRIFLSVVLLAMCISCHKDMDIIIREDKIPDPPAVQITTRLVIMTDTLDATAETGEMTVNGFHLDFESLPFAWTPSMMTDQSYATMHLTTSDHKSLFAVRSWLPNDINYHHWVIPEFISTSSHSNQHTTIPLDSEHRLIIPAEDLMKVDSTAYSGSYTVEYALLNPAQVPHAAIPSHTGISESGGTESLLFATCFYIRFVDDSGLPLYSRSAAHIAINSEDPHDTWQFSAEKGCWIPANSTSQSDEILVPHEGYYATAQAEALVIAEGIAMINGTPLIHTALHFQYRDQYRILYTSNTGRWIAALPAGEEIKTSVFHACQSQLIQTFTPTLQHTMISLSWEADAVVTSTLKATVRDCNALPVEDQIILTDGVPERFIFADAATIEMPLALCAQSHISVQPLNTSSLETGPEVLWEAREEIEVGSLFACEKAKGEYLMLEVAGEQKMYWDLKSVLMADQRLVVEDGPDASQIEFMMYIQSPQEGFVPDSDLNILFEDTQLGTRGYSLYCPTATSGCGFSKFALTHYPVDQGEWIRGHFEGTFWIKTFTPLTAGYRAVKGQLQLMRDF